MKKKQVKKNEKIKKILKSTRNSAPLRKNKMRSNYTVKPKSTSGSKRSPILPPNDFFDKILLAMRQKPYAKLLSQIESGKRRLSEERKLALRLGVRILSRAKEVRDSIINPTKSKRS